MMMMLAVLLISVALTAVCNAQLDFHFGFRIAGASDGDANGL
jgi:hypothetical protein